LSLKELCKSYNLELDNSFYQDCEIFINLLQKWGTTHNLSGSLATKDINENILDSIFPLSFVDSFSSFADIGTGAGYPGLIIAILKKDIKAYLIEPRVKRVAFLNYVKASLDLKNLTVLQKRVEEVNDLKVDFICSRAVTNTKLLLELTKDIKKTNSSYLFYKGSLLQNELEEAKLNNYIVKQRNNRNYLYIKEN